MLSWRLWISSAMSRSTTSLEYVERLKKRETHYSTSKKCKRVTILCYEKTHSTYIPWLNYISFPFRNVDVFIATFSNHFNVRSSHEKVANIWRNKTIHSFRHSRWETFSPLVRPSSDQDQAERHQELLTSCITKQRMLVSERNNEYFNEMLQHY